MADEKNVVALPTSERDALAGAVAEFRRKLPQMIEHRRIAR